MSTTITVEEAQVRLKDLVGSLAPGEEVLITQQQVPVARLVGERHEAPRPRRAGNCRGLIHLTTEDDEHLADFGEYMR